MSKELQIRNSTVDLLVFTRDAGEDGIEVRVQNGDVSLTQKAITRLFDVDRSVVTKHLKNIFEENLSAEELSKFRKDILISYYSRPSYIWQKLFAEKLTFGVFCNYVKHGIKLLKNLFYQEQFWEKLKDTIS